MDRRRQREMEAPGRAGKRAPLGWLCILAPALLAGCLSDRASLEKKLLAETPSAAHAADVASAYRVNCPDVIEIRIINRPDLHWTTYVDVDGALPVDYLARPRVEGRTRDEIAKLIAARLGVSDQNVVVEIKDYNSKQVHIFGQVKGSPQSLPYRGPETVLEVLQRAGGITAGADASDVYVVRSNIAAGKAPEVFHVDLRAIVLQQDHKTNLRVQAFDQIHVGETTQALVERCIAPWMRPFQRALWDTRPEDQPAGRPWRNLLKEVRRAYAEKGATTSPRASE